MTDTHVTSEEYSSLTDLQKQALTMLKDNDYTVTVLPESTDGNALFLLTEENFNLKVSVPESVTNISSENFLSHMLWNIRTTAERLSKDSSYTASLELFSGIKTLNHLDAVWLDTAGTHIATLQDKVNHACDALNTNKIEEAKEALKSVRDEINALTEDSDEIIEDRNAAESALLLYYLENCIPSI